MNQTLRQIPQVQALLSRPPLLDLIVHYGHEAVADAVRGQLNEIRAGLLNGSIQTLPAFDDAAFADGIGDRIAQSRRPQLRAVVNATGIVIHTNLGRARLAPEALQQIADVAGSASTLEFDLESGKRGRRGHAVEQLLCAVTGAEAAIVVNNCAAAVLLGLTALAQGREVVASRGELIEIGGSFRMPDVIAQSGAMLREVGTTNKTRLDDYAGAIDADTAVLLKSHPSNYRIVGFTGAPERAALGRLARDSGVLLVEDLGSGVLTDLDAFGIDAEPVVADVLRQGVDLVMFSGDKLLGGPQAGILAGRGQVIDRLRSHPMYRALRSDKLTLAALEATLRLYLPPHDPLSDVPVLRMIATPVETLHARAESLCDALGRPPQVTVTDSKAQVGAGAMPERDLPSVALRIESVDTSPDVLAARLRLHAPPIIGRIHAGALMLDLRSVEAAELPEIINALRTALP